MTTVRTALAGSALVALAFRLDAGLAARWRDAVSLPAMRALNRLTARVPFPVLEPLAALIAGAALWTLAAALVRASARRSPAPLGRWLRWAMRALALPAAAMTALWLPVCAAPIAKPASAACAGRAAGPGTVAGAARLCDPEETVEARQYVASESAAGAATVSETVGRNGLPPRGPVAVSGASEAEALCGELIDALNANPPRLPPPGEVLSLAPEAAGMEGCAVKAARYPEWLRALGLAGVFAPPTGEIVVDAGLPAPLLPFTAVHELMHLAGICDEGAANIAAWRCCAEAGGAFADSARLWALRYAMGLLRDADREARRRVGARMGDGLRALYDACGGDIPASAGGSYATLARWLTRWNE